MVESEDYLGDLLLAKDFYLPKFKLSSLRLSSYLKDFFFWFFDTIYSTKSSKYPLFAFYFLSTLSSVFMGKFSDGTNFFGFWFNVLFNYLLFSSSLSFLNISPVKFSSGTLTFFCSAYFFGPVFFFGASMIFWFWIFFYYAYLSWFLAITSVTLLILTALFMYFSIFYFTLNSN